MSHTFKKNAKEIAKNHYLLKKGLFQLFPTQKNVLYNILNVSQNINRGTHKKWVTRSQKTLIKQIKIYYKKYFLNYT